MNTGLILLIFLGTLVYVLGPFVFPRIQLTGQISGERSRAVSDLEESRDNLLTIIKDLEFEYEMGKLSEEHFKEMKAQYSRKVIILLKEIDRVQNGKNHPEIIQADSDLKEFCPVCDSPSKRSDRFCGNCGSQLS